MNSERKKILVLNFFPAFSPPRSGGELRYFHLYRFLRQFYDITMIDPTHLFVEPEVIHHFENMIEHRVPKNKYHLFFHRLFNVIGRFSECSAVVVMLASYFDKALREKVHQHLSSADIVIHESPFLIPIVTKREGQIMIYNSYNVEYDLQRDILKGPAGRLLSNWVRRMERRACRRADLVFATSEEDRLRFAELYKLSRRKIIHVPNGVDPEDIHPPAPGERASARKALDLPPGPILLFFGSAHPPNVEAAEFILAQLCPLFEQATFVVAGNVCKHFEGLERSNARLLGRVPDEEKRLLLHAADVALNPMFSGSGTNLKMFDYLSAGLPVITSPVGARGIPIASFREAVITEPYAFAPAIKQVLGRPELKDTLSTNARAMVVEKFHWKHIARSVHNAILDLKKRHITVVNDFGIYPPRHGGQYRISGLYGQVRKSIPVFYVCLHKESGRIEETSISENFTQIAVPKGFFQRVLESIMGRYLGFSIDDIIGILFAPRNRCLRREIKQAAARNDVFVSSHPYLWNVIEPYSDKVRIYESHNYETQLKGANLQGHFAPLLVRLVRWIEGRAIRHSDAVLTVSDEEEEILSRDFGVTGKYTLVPNGTDTASVIIPTREEKEYLRDYLDLPRAPIALFIGSAHPPNVEAGRHLITTIAPQTPEILYFIVGSVCWVLKNLPDRPVNVKLFFEVSESIRNEIFKLADIAVNPMTKGAGTSLKMFDYLAAGLPVVSTPLGARGVAKKESNFLILCELEEFPMAVKNLCSHSEKPDRLRKQGRRFVEENYDWRVIAQKFCNYVSKLQQRQPSER